MISSKLISHFDMNVFPRVVWILLIVETSAEKSPWKTSIVWKTALVPQYLLTRMWSIIFSCEFFRYFEQV